MSSPNTFQVSVETVIKCPRGAVFDYVSDLSRSSEWSPECRGGAWTSGSPSEVGSVFTAHNYRTPDVVSWAPVVRGAWTTECQVVESEAPRIFSWAMRNGAGEPQESVWSFSVAPADAGSMLTHAFWMGELTEGMRGILSGLSEAERRKFLVDWEEKLQGDMRQSVSRIKVALETAC